MFESIVFQIFINIFGVQTFKKTMIKTLLIHLVLLTQE